MSPLHAYPTLAVGPVMPGWGSWDWVGAFILKHLNGPCRTSSFKPWEIPTADVVVIVKHAPPIEWIESVFRRSAVVYCPIDSYGDPVEIDVDAVWIRKCARVVVNCHRLTPYFAPLAETAYIDHPIKFATRTRKAYRADGPLLWVGVRTNLPPVVAWVNAHPLPAPLDVLTNLEKVGKVPTATELGFRPDRDVRVHEWSPERHLALTKSARAALDVKGDDFRSRHKPPAKAIDFIASGLPLALNPDSSPAEHLAELGFQVPSPLDPQRWLSTAYWKETRKLGERLTRELAPDRVAGKFLEVIKLAITTRPTVPPTAYSTVQHPVDADTNPSANRSRVRLTSRGGIRRIDENGVRLGAVTSC